MGILLSGGADINAQNDTGNTALHQAVINENVDSVELLLEYGADCNLADKDGRTPLSDAIRYKAKEIVKLLSA